MMKQNINPNKMWRKILLIAIIVAFAFILTLCSKKTTSPEEKLLAPSSLEISLIENNKIQISWTDNSTNETKFLIDRKKGVDNWFEKYNEVAANITTFNDIIPTNSDTIYSYRVRAFDGNDYSAYSDTVAWFSENSAPTNLQLEQITQDSIKLTWQDKSVGELNFRVDRKIGDANWQENYKILEPDTTIFIDYTPSLYDTCYYKVFAVCGNSYSDSTQNYFIPFLPAPSNLQIDQLSATSIKLTWQDNCEGEDGYWIYKKEEGSDWDSTNVSANTEEWTDEDVIPGIVNYYKVCAFIGDDHSGYIEGNINALPAPSDLIAIIIDKNKIRLDWDDNSSFEEGYKIERRRCGEDYEVLATVNANETTYTDESVESHGIYYYLIQGFYQNFESDYSNESNIYWSQQWVPDDFPTIQSAIDAVMWGDTVLVSPGVYIENIEFNTHGITVASFYLTTNDTSYISQTVIDGNHNGSVIKFENCGSTTILNGFTLTNGSSNKGGGIYCYYSNPKLENLIISNNNAEQSGGGLYCSYYYYSYTPINFKNVRVIRNTANDGGGIYFSNCIPVLTNVKVDNNNAFHDCGGICFSSCHTCDSDPILTNVIVHGNIASRRGGGICCYDSDPTMINNIISNNTASSGEGGGICCFNSFPIIINNTISNNIASGEGGGAIYSWYSGPHLFNTILWNNSPQEIYNAVWIYHVTATYSCIQGDYSGIGNINSNPRFVDLNNDDFHLQTDSPCIDAGNPDPQYNDTDGTRNDMGAYGGPGGDW